MEPFPPERLETSRLVLRLPRLEDANEIFDGYARDPEVTRNVAWRPHRDVLETRAFLETRVHAWHAQSDERGWVIEQRRSGAVMGMIGYRHFGSRISLGYVLARSHHGNGYMTEAVTAVRDVAFQDAAIFRVEAFCDTENIASARVMQKAGMQLEGTLRRYAIHPNISDEPRDCFLYAIVR